MVKAFMNHHGIYKESANKLPRQANKSNEQDSRQRRNSRPRCFPRRSRPSIQQRLKGFDNDAHVRPKISFILHTQRSHCSQLVHKEDTQLEYKSQLLVTIRHESVSIDRKYQAHGSNIYIHAHTANKYTDHVINHITNALPIILLSTSYTFSRKNGNALEIIITKISSSRKIGFPHYQSTLQHLR